MITKTPPRSTPADPPAGVRAPPPGQYLPPKPGSWRYGGRPRSRWIPVGSILVSVGFHVGLLYGFRASTNKAPPFQPEVLMSLDLVPPIMEDLEDPEPVVSDEPTPVEDLGIQVPMQSDAPQLPQPSDFVQQLDFASMNPHPDIDRPKVFTIPGNINRGGKGGEGLGKIFDLKDLDRQPVPIFQPAPVAPKTLTNDGAFGTVNVEFVVLVDGTVSQLLSRDSTDYRFNEAAMRGVAKWKFKPGMKNGRRVNTRMMVPIVFKPKTGDE